MPRGGRGAAPDVVPQDLSCRRCAGVLWLSAELSEKAGRNPPRGTPVLLSTGLGLLHTSKRGVKTAAKMKSKHLQVWEFPRRATKLPSFCPRSSAFT